MVKFSGVHTSMMASCEVLLLFFSFFFVVVLI